MLTYVYETLREQGYKDVETEDFEDAKDLFAAILIKGTSFIIKRGLIQEYVPYNDELSTVKGKINVTDSLKKLTLYRNKVICDYDEFSVNNTKNKIIKSTFNVLLKSDLKDKTKNKINDLLAYFKQVDLIDLSSVDWHFRFNRNDQNYRLVLSICYLVKLGLIQTDKAGNTKLMNYIDNKLMYHLYEKFILEYYRKEHPEIKANASQIPWALDDDFNAMLPIMQSDITLSKDDKILIIDAKYYIKNLQSRYSTTVISGNLYQIFTYVKNKQYEVKDQDIIVSGMLLYAKTDQENVENNDYHMSGNLISTRTLDLSVDFSLVKKQLDDIVNKYFIA